MLKVPKCQKKVKMKEDQTEVDRELAESNARLAEMVTGRMIIRKR